MNRLPEIKAFIKDEIEVGKYGERVTVKWTTGHAPSVHMIDERGETVETTRLTSEWTVDRLRAHLSERGFEPIGNARTEL